jgi:rhodanese-related sulfurtransferase
VLFERILNDVKSWVDKYRKDKLIVLYCACPDEATNASMARELINMGFANVHVLKGGWNEWLKANYPTDKK